jgi:hypothetical protein
MLNLLLLTGGYSKKDDNWKKKRIFADYEICDKDWNIIPNTNVVSQLWRIRQVGKGD